MRGLAFGVALFILSETRGGVALEQASTDSFSSLINPKWCVYVPKVNCSMSLITDL